MAGTTLEVSVNQGISFQHEGVYDVKSYGAKGDGVTDDTLAIQAAIDSAELVRGACFFPPTANGYLTERIAIETGNIKIYGLNTKIIHKYSTIVDGSTGSGSTKAWPVFMVYRDSHNVEITGFEFTSHESIATAIAALDSGWETYLAPICIHNADNANIYDNKFLGDGNRGVFQHGGDAMNLHDNLFDGVGITVHVGYTLNTNFWDVGTIQNSPTFSPIDTRIASNLFLNYAADHGACLFTSGLQRFVIEGNRIESMNQSSQNALMVYCNDLGVTDSSGVLTPLVTGVVKNNIIDGVFLQGIRIDGYSSTAVEHIYNMTVEGNCVTGTGTGLWTEDPINSRFTDNHVIVDGHALHCVRYLTGTVFDGNHFESTGAGTSVIKATVSFGSTLSAEDTRFVNNTFVTPSSQTHCFYVNGITKFSNVTIDNNVFNYNGTSRVIFDDESTELLTVSNNKLRIGTDHPGNSDPYIELESSAKVMYIGNALISAVNVPYPDYMKSGSLLYSGNVGVGAYCDVAGLCEVSSNTLSYTGAEVTATLKFLSVCTDVICNSNDVTNTKVDSACIQSEATGTISTMDNTVSGNSATGLIRFSHNTVASAARNKITNSGAGGTGYTIISPAVTVIETSGTGSPEGVVLASIGSKYIDTAGGTGVTIYFKEANNQTNTGWAAV